jgi:hypothetical protein
MNKINFEDLPSTETPLNAENLNQLQTNIEDALFYKDGDTYVLSSSTYFGGQISGGSKEVLFSIPLPKRLNKIKGITVNSYDITVRSNNGGYAANRITSGFTVMVNQRQDNLISFVFTWSEALSATNNSPCGVALYNLSLTFNE